MKQRGMARKAALVVAGTALLAGVELAAAGAAPAAAPGLIIKPGAIWTFEARGPSYIPCEQDVFTTQPKSRVGSFTEKDTRGGSDAGGAGTWVGGGGQISMFWTSSSQESLRFTGTLNSTRRQFAGSVSYLSINENGVLRHKAVSGC